METEAKKLVEVFVNSKQTEFVTSYDLTRFGKPTGEKIVVLVLRTNADGVKTTQEFSVNIRKAVAGPRGIPCACCGGTGKV